MQKKGGAVVPAILITCIICLGVAWPNGLGGALGDVLRGAGAGLQRAAEAVADGRALNAAALGMATASETKLP